MIKRQIDQKQNELYSLNPQQSQQRPRQQQNTQFERYENPSPAINNFYP